MSLSAFDCIGRGTANLRANWELVLMQLAQTIVCSVLAVVGAVALFMLVGASFLLELGNLSDWQSAVERLQGLSVGWGLLAIALAAATILLTVVGLIYCWFQAGILATLDRGERQAPLVPSVTPPLFRTFTGRSFMGWSSGGAWRYFGFFGLVGLYGTVAIGIYALVMVLGLVALGDIGIRGLFAAGCAAMLPFGGLVILLNLWFLIGMALLAREEVSVWKATHEALRILWRRLAGALLIVVLFIIASLGVGLVFWPLGQGMAMALEGSAAAWFAVQFLLTLAQWLVNGILTVALLGSAVALVRGELEQRPA